MKLIKPDAQIIKGADPFKHVELVGRTCYKSEDKITDDSCFGFVERLIERQHFAMLEHARFTFLIDDIWWVNRLVGIPGVVCQPLGIYEFEGHKDPYIVGVSMSHLYNPKWSVVKELFEAFKLSVEWVFTSHMVPEWNVIDLEDPDDGNFRYVDDECWKEIYSYYDDEEAARQYFSEFIYHSIKFTCDRGVSHELVRHRVAVAQESTRYCNYSKSKYGGECTFVEPADYDSFSKEAKGLFEDNNRDAEIRYMRMLDLKYTPQQARAVLPNSLKTEVILTMNEDQWKHFFDVRSRGTTGAPHPDMKVVADIAQGLLNL